MTVFYSLFFLSLTQCLQELQHFAKGDENPGPAGIVFLKERSDSQERPGNVSSQDYPGSCTPILREGARFPFLPWRFYYLASRNQSFSSWYLLENWHRKRCQRGNCICLLFSVHACFCLGPRAWNQPPKWFQAEEKQLEADALSLQNLRSYNYHREIFRITWSGRRVGVEGSSQAPGRPFYKVLEIPGKVLVDLTRVRLGVGFVSFLRCPHSEFLSCLV